MPWGRAPLGKFLYSKYVLPSTVQIKNSVTKVTFISERDCELIQDKVIGAPSLIKKQGGKNK